MFIFLFFFVFGLLVIEFSGLNAISFGGLNARAFATTLGSFFVGVICGIIIVLILILFMLYVFWMYIVCVR